MMKALGQDIDDRMKIAVDREKTVAAKHLSGASVKSRVPHPVLVAMGEEGRLRAMWEYYNVWCQTRPGFGKTAILTDRFTVLSVYYCRPCPNRQGLYTT
jgi:hypothetical protein